MSKMMRNLFRNRKGTAEVIGSVMFIVILLFFFTNVYLWHDAATKEMNDLYLDKMNARMELSYNSGVKELRVTANGSDVILSRLWIIEESGSRSHLYANLTDSSGIGVKIDAGKSITIQFVSQQNQEVPVNPQEYVNSNIASNPIMVYYYLDVPVTCTVINTLGVTVSTYCTP